MAEQIASQSAGVFTFPGAVKTGDLIALFVAWNGGGSGDPTLTDTQGNTYRVRDSETHADYKCAICWTFATANTSSGFQTTVTNWSTFASNIYPGGTDVLCGLWRGYSAEDAWFGTNNKNGAGENPDGTGTGTASTPLATTGTWDLVLGNAFWASGTPTLSSGYDLIDWNGVLGNSSGVFYFEGAVQSPGSIHVVSQTSAPGNWDQVAVAFKRSGSVVTVGTSTASISGATSAALAKPHGVLPGDVIVANYGGDGTGGASTQEGGADAALTPPTGFTTFHHYCGSGNNWLTWVMYRVADGTEGSSFTPHTSSTINNGGAVLTVLRGLDSTTPVLSVSASDSQGGNPHTAFATSTEGYSAAVSMICAVSSNNALSFPSGWNNTTDGGHAGSGQFADIACDLTSVSSAILPAQTVTTVGTPTGGYVILNQFALRVAGSTRTGVAVLQAVAAENDHLAFPSAVQDGSTLIAGIMWFAGSTSGPPTDSLGLTWTAIPGSKATGPGGAYATYTEFFKATVPAGGGGACTVNGSFTSGYDRVALWEVIGNVDVATATYGTDSGGTHGNDAGSFTPTKNNAVILGMWTANGTNGWSPESYWTMLIQDTAGGGGTAIGYTSQTTAALFDVALTTGNTGTLYSSSGLAVVPPVTGAPITASAQAVAQTAASTRAAAQVVESAVAITQATASARASSLLSPSAQAQAAAVATVTTTSPLVPGAQAVAAATGAMHAPAIVVPAAQAVTAAAASAQASAVLAASAQAVAAAVASVTTALVPQLFPGAQATGAVSAVVRAPAVLAPTGGVSAQATAAVATGVLLVPQAAALTHAAGTVVTVLVFAFTTSTSMTYALVTTEST